jgi:hypothetical protein
MTETLRDLRVSVVNFLVPPHIYTIAPDRPFLAIRLG